MSSEKEVQTVRISTDSTEVQTEGQTVTEIARNTEGSVEDCLREKVLEPWDIWNHLPQISCTQITWLIFVVMLAIADANFFGQGYILTFKIKKVAV